jgi:hypothetical protein
MNEFIFFKGESMKHLFLVLFLCFIVLSTGCGDTSSSSSNLTSWTLADPYVTGGAGTLDSSTTTVGNLTSTYDSTTKNVTGSLTDNPNNLHFVRDENGNILTGNITSDTNSIDLSN